jgi:hypothetical protein
VRSVQFYPKCALGSILIVSTERDKNSLQFSTIIVIVKDNALQATEIPNVVRIKIRAARRWVQSEQC